MSEMLRATIALQDGSIEMLEAEIERLQAELKQANAEREELRVHWYNEGKRVGKRAALETEQGESDD